MSVDKVDTGFLETLLGYNARRAALTIIELFLERMAIYQLRPVDFSVLSLVAQTLASPRASCAPLWVFNHPIWWDWWVRWRSAR